MALKFHQLKVEKIRRETEDAVSVFFDIPEDLKEDYKYKSGQYFTLRFFFDEQDNRRSYSICTSPYTDDGVAVTVKKVEGGAVSPYINDTLTEGQLVDVMTPTGNFTVDPNPEAEKSYILFGGGSGITPLMSIIKTVLSQEKNSKVLLVYANVNEDAIIFKEKLSELDKEYSDRFNVIHHLDNSEGSTIEHRQGRIDKEQCINILNLLDKDIVNNSEYYLCGPGGMMVQIENALEEKGIDKKKVHKESFTVEDEDGNPKEIKKTKESTEEVTSIKVILYGEETEIDINDNETILAAGIRAGIDPPFSCQIGACSTCRAKLKSGEVDMEADDALMEDEIEEGFILTCSCYPLTSDVVVDYDDNF